MCKMADSSKQDAAIESDEKELSKSLAKRKYLLVDEDLNDLDHELKDNPLNKGYAPMKVFKASEIKRIAIDKWGSLENIEIEQQKRKERQTNLAEKKEKEMRHFWDCEEIYSPMKTFMENIDLPKKNLAEEQSDASKSLLTSDVILCFCDCMNSRPPGSFGKTIYKTFTAASEVNNSTPYNDRRKMGHFTWAVVNNGDKDQLIVNLYVVHKWNFKSKVQSSSFPVLIFGALELALKRLSKLLVEEWEKISENKFCLNIGTYRPYKVEPEKFNNTLKESFELPVQVFTDLAH